MATKDTALATVDASNYAIMQAEPEMMSDILNDNLGGGGISPFQLKRIKTPAAGMTLWTVPVGASGEEHAGSFQGIILYQQPGRTFYARPLGQGGEANQPPDCSSADNLTGFGVRFDGDQAGAHDCATCPLARWQGRTPPPCKEHRTLFILRERDMLPVMMSVPRTGLKPLKDYMLGLSYDGVSYTGVVTEFGLEKVKGNGTPDYARITLQSVARLTPGEVARVKMAQAAIKSIADNRVPAYAAQQPQDDGAPQDMTDEVL